MKQRLYKSKTIQKQNFKAKLFRNKLFSEQQNHWKLIFAVVFWGWVSVWICWYLIQWIHTAASLSWDSAYMQFSLRSCPSFIKFQRQECLSVFFLYVNLGEIRQWAPTVLGAWNSQTETDNVITQVLRPQETQLKLNACDTEKLPL